MRDPLDFENANNLEAITRLLYNRTSLNLTELDDTFEINWMRNLRIFDTVDYVVPANEYNSIFVMTNFIETKQTLDSCDEVCLCCVIHVFNRIYFNF